jgi:hypothetical protein
LLSADHLLTASLETFRGVESELVEQLRGSPDFGSQLVRVGTNLLAEQIEQRLFKRKNERRRLRRALKPRFKRSRDTSSRMARVDAHGGVVMSSKSPPSAPRRSSARNRFDWSAVTGSLASEVRIAPLRRWQASHELRSSGSWWSIREGITVRVSFMAAFSLLVDTEGCHAPPAIHFSGRKLPLFACGDPRCQRWFDFALKPAD